LKTDNKLKAGLNYLADVWPKGGGLPKKSTWSENTKTRFGELKSLGVKKKIISNNSNG
jgi:hypothetical protein